MVTYNAVQIVTISVRVITIAVKMVTSQNFRKCKMVTKFASEIYIIKYIFINQIYYLNIKNMKIKHFICDH